VEIKNSDYVIVVTNGHTKDTLVLESLLKNPPAYIGVIGSRHKKIHVENYLAEKGFSEDLIKQIIMPIGLDIKAETPSEIAISIVAQLIQKRAQ
jgi:xanthine dehydrogenase accessory factor